jgi:hypothetical protein
MLLGSNSPRFICADGASEPVGGAVVALEQADVRAAAPAVEVRKVLLVADIGPIIAR